MWCRTCCLSAHKNSPFHRIQRWTGKYFASTSLYHEGFVLHLGHGGSSCPKRSHASQDPQPSDGIHHSNISQEDLGEESGEDDDLEGLHDEAAEDGNFNPEDVVVVIIHSTGIFRHKVCWCSCTGPRDHHLQLLRYRLFPASLTRPRTAFTFDVLDHFHIDSMDCKTAAMSFFAKLRRFTDNAFPHTVQVFVIYVPTKPVMLTPYCRIGTVN